MAAIVLGLGSAVDDHADDDAGDGAGGEDCDWRCVDVADGSFRARVAVVDAPERANGCPVDAVAGDDDGDRGDDDDDDDAFADVSYAAGVDAAAAPVNNCAQLTLLRR